MELFLDTAVLNLISILIKFHRFSLKSAVVRVDQLVVPVSHSKAKEEPQFLYL